jgi:hypothetical protein
MPGIVAPAPGPRYGPQCPITTGEVCIRHRGRRRCAGSAPGPEWASSPIPLARLGRDDRAQVVEAWLEHYAPRGQTRSDVDPSFASMQSSSSR